MDYKEDFRVEEFKTRDFHEDERGAAPNRHVGVQTTGAAQGYNINQTTSLKPELPAVSCWSGKIAQLKIDSFSSTVKKMLNMQNEKATPVAIPHLQELQIKERKNPYDKSQVIVLTMPDEISAVDQEAHIRKTFGIVYEVLQEMSPDLTFQPSLTDLKCKVTFTHDFCTGRFEIQVWRVEGNGQHILEFRRKSLGGRDAYEYLIRHMGAELKKKGCAEKYGNDIEIFPLPEIVDGLGDLAMPSFGGVGSLTGKRPIDETKGFPITLDSEDQIENWSDIVTKRNWPSCGETLRLCARSCLHQNNREMLARHTGFQKAVVKELQQNGDATNCHNALTIIHNLLEKTDSGGSFEEDELLSAVAECLMTYSGVKQKGSKQKTLRSVALERAALKVLLLLSENVAKYDQKQVHFVLKLLEGELDGKLKDKVNQVQLEYVIGNLKKRK